MKIKKQEDVKDCGLHVIQSIHQHYFKEWISINELKHQSNLVDKGLNVQSLIELGNDYGIILEAFNAPAKSLKSNEYYVVVVKNAGQMHYVLTRWDGREFEIWDPAKGHYTMSFDEFSENYTSVVITIKKGVYSNRKIDLDITNIWKYLFSNINIIIWIIVILTISLILSFASTIFLKLIFDKVIPNRMTKLLNLICISFIFLAILRISVSYSKKYFNKKLCNIIEIDLTKRYLNKFKSAIMMHINKIDSSDHMRRLSLIPASSLFLATGIQIIFDECITLVISSSILIWINPKLFGIAMAISSANALISLLFNFFIKEKYLKLISVYKTEFKNRNEIIYSYKNIKEKKRSFFLFNSWMKKYYEYKELDYSIWKYTALLSGFTSLLTFIAPIILSYFSVKLIINNDLTTGSFLMFLSLFSFFISPLNALSEFFIKIKQNLKHIELLQYVMEIPEEKINVNGHRDFKISQIKINNLKVKIGSPILDIKNLEFANKTILAGANGTGKSILLKTLAGSIDYKGTITYDNIDGEYLSKEAIRNKILMISDEEYIPAMTILDYITMANKENLKLWYENDKNHHLSNFLKSNGINLNDVIIENAQKLSQGQKQIIKLMRIFAAEFDLLILDESFEFVSQKNFIYLKNKIEKSTNFLIEVSHSKRYISKGKEINLEQVNQNLY